MRKSQNIGICARGIIESLEARRLLTVTPFFGEDLGLGEHTALASHPRADAARDDFFSHLTGGVATETFEGFSDGATSPLAVHFGSDTATLQGTGEINDVPQGQTTPDGRYAISGTKYWDTTSSFSLTFSRPQAAFGFYGVDIGDYAGRVTLQLANGTNETVTVPHTINGLGGGVLYFGIIANASSVFTGISFGNTAPDIDFFGFDDFTIGRLQDVSRFFIDEQQTHKTVFGFDRPNEKLALTVVGGGLKDPRLQVELTDLTSGTPYPIKNTNLSANTNGTELLVWANLGLGPSQWKMKVTLGQESKFVTFNVVPEAPNHISRGGWQYPLQTMVVTTPWLQRKQDGYVELNGKPKAHLGADLRGGRGTEVASIGNGTVIDWQGAVNGFPDGQKWGKDNSALAIKYESARGPFVAVYGHIRNIPSTMSLTAPHNMVTVGQRIGDIGAFDGGDHLHFGIHYPEVTMPPSGWGLMDASSLKDGSAHFTNGFFDPLYWIETVARAASRNSVALAPVLPGRFLSERILRDERSVFSTSAVRSVLGEIPERDSLAMLTL